jgi:hypothetical protein
MGKGRSACNPVSRSLGREVNPVTFEPETDYLLHRYLRTVRSKHDPERRARMEDLRDDEPLFLSRRGTTFG